MAHVVRRFLADGSGPDTTSRSRLTVGIFDAMQASTWRRIAAERRELWEARQHVFRGAARGELAYWDDSWSNPRCRLRWGIGTIHSLPGGTPTPRPTLPNGLPR